MDHGATHGNALALAAGESRCLPVEEGFEADRRPNSSISLRIETPLLTTIITCIAVSLNKQTMSARPAHWTVKQAPKYVPREYAYAQVWPLRLSVT
ncbi:UNVERIFIED_ORG: hypothetical protein QE434_002493 [Rhizobium sp. SORGH_AS 755]|nr:hypothetical protein [Rhizobium sp. SORGH_AS_0755]